MSAIDPSSFEVISQDAHGDPVRCSLCLRPVPCVVVLHRIPEPDGSDLWLGICAFCVLGMARALARNSNESSNEGQT